MTVKGESRAAIVGPAGLLDIVVNAPAVGATGSSRGIALIAHPHPLQGGTMDNKVVQTLAKTFAALGYVSVRFNFRGVGGSEGAFDDGVGETEDALAALAHARREFTGGPDDMPVVLAGFSFGSFVQTRVAQTITPERMVLVGPAVKRFAMFQPPPDTIVIHGEEDDVVALTEVLDWARPQQLPIVVFPGCGHFFHGRLPQLQRVIAGMWRPQSPAGGAAGLGG